MNVHEKRAQRALEIARIDEELSKKEHEERMKAMRRNDLNEKLKSTTVPPDINEHLHDDDFDHIASYYIKNHNPALVDSVNDECKVIIGSIQKEIRSGKKLSVSWFENDNVAWLGIYLDFVRIYFDNCFPKKRHMWVVHPYFITEKFITFFRQHGVEIFPYLRWALTEAYGKYILDQHLAEVYPHAPFTFHQIRLAREKQIEMNLHLKTDLLYEVQVAGNAQKYIWAIDIKSDKWRREVGETFSSTNKKKKKIPFNYEDYLLSKGIKRVLQLSKDDIVKWIIIYLDAWLHPRATHFHCQKVKRDTKMVYELLCDIYKPLINWSDGEAQ